MLIKYSMDSRGLSQFLWVKILPPSPKQRGKNLWHPKFSQTVTSNRKPSKGIKMSATVKIRRTFEGKHAGEQFSPLVQWIIAPHPLRETSRLKVSMTQFLRVLLVLTALLLASAVEGRSRRRSFRKFRTRRLRPAVKRIPVNAVGRVTCNGEPLPNVQLRLMDSVPFRLDAKLAYTRTDENGNFNVTSKGSKVPKLPKGRLGVLLRLILAKRSRTPRPFIKVEYSYRSVNGSLKVLGVKRFRRFRRFFVRNDISEVVPFNSSGVDFGTINVSSIHCRAYLRFYEALQLFNTRAPTLALPYRILFVKTETPNLGSDGPIATTKTILFPTMFQNITAEIANHEFAHTFRQSYDGDFRHFKNDLKRYVAIMQKLRTAFSSSLICFSFSSFFLSSFSWSSSSNLICL